MKRWQLAFLIAALFLLAGVNRRLESSRRFQNVKHALETKSGDLPAFDRLLVGLLA